MGPTDSIYHGVPRKQTDTTRCFITAVEVEKPEHNRLVSRVSIQADHAIGNGFRGSFSVVDGSKYKVGDVVNVTIEVEGLR